MLDAMSTDEEEVIPPSKSTPQPSSVLVQLTISLLRLMLMKKPSS